MDCGEGPGQACSSWLAMAPGHCNCTARPGEARLSSWRLCSVPPLEPNLLQTPPEEPPWPDVPPAAPQSKLKPRLMGETPATEGQSCFIAPTQLCPCRPDAAWVGPCCSPRASLLWNIPLLHLLSLSLAMTDWPACWVDLADGAGLPGASQGPWGCAHGRKPTPEAVGAPGSVQPPCS